MLTLLGVLGVALVVPQIENEREPGHGSRITFAIPDLVKRVGTLNQDLVKERPTASGSPGRRSPTFTSARSARLLAARPVVGFRGHDVRLRNQSADGAFAYLAAAGPRQSADGRQRFAGRHPPQARAYGFLRLSVPLAPDASLSFGVPVLGSLAVVGVIYAAFCSLGQDDIKKLVAYSSVSHLGMHARFVRPQRNRPDRQPASDD